LKNISHVLVFVILSRNIQLGIGVPWSQILQIVTTIIEQNINHLRISLPSSYYTIIIIVQHNLTYHTLTLIETDDD